MTRDRKDRPWLPFLYIIAACALAHLWCLGSRFYMDDATAIQTNASVLNGRFWQMSLLSWTTLWYAIQYRLFGMSPAGFHAVNWLLHTGAACALFGFGRDFIKPRWPAGVALFGALLFAVHPLASEIPNYARTQDLAWVTLFSLLAAWAMLRFLRDGGSGKLALCGLAVAGAAFSKGPGLFHALMAVTVVALACVKPGYWPLIRRRWKGIAGTIAVLLVASWLTGVLSRWLSGTARWKDPRFIGHAYTLSRVFWKFAWRAVVPTALSSDHEVTETLIPPGTAWWNIPDKMAMLAMVCFFALAGFSLFLAKRKPTRLVGVCLFLFVATILFRLLYLIPEFMPEYRIYPGLPWFCLAAAITLTAVWQWMFETISPKVPALLLLGTFTFLSAKRSFVWHDIHRLAGDVLERYPARARAVWQMDEQDAQQGNWQAIIDRQRYVWPEVERRFVDGNKQLAPAREIPSGDFVLAMVGIFGNYARAVGHMENPAAGLLVMAQLEAHMKQMKMNPDNKPLEWGYFYHDKALLLEMAGNHQAAAACLRQKCVSPIWGRDLERIEKKLAESKP